MQIAASPTAARRRAPGLRPRPDGPATLIRSSGKTYLELAAAGNISINTVTYAVRKDAWPAHRRTREGLRRALGLPPEAAPIQTPAHTAEIGGTTPDLRAEL